MRRQQRKKYQQIITRLLLGVYLFTLFSQDFHDHKFSSIFKDFHFKKTENIISKNIATDQSQDCLACHFITTCNTLIPEEFVYSFGVLSQHIQRTFLVQEKIWSETKYSFQLRGPPSIF